MTAEAAVATQSGGPRLPDGVGLVAVSEAGGQDEEVDDTAIGLPEAIRSLRAELSEAMREGAGEALRFRVGPVELEFAVQITREANVEGGVKFWVVSAGAKGSTGAATTHRLKISLQPQTAGGEDAMVAEDVTQRPT